MPAGREPIAADAVGRWLGAHPGWKVEGGRLRRDLRFPSFKDAMQFVNRVADAAEQRQHHPNILVHEWCFVRLELYTHTAGAITQADLDAAVAFDALVPVSAIHV